MEYWKREDRCELLGKRIKLGIVEEWKNGNKKDVTSWTEGINSESRGYEIVVRPSDLKSSSKEMAGMFLSTPVIKTWDKASTKDMVLFLA